jgi:hypothetical protein
MKDSAHNIKISILLPTRGRQQMLKRSIMSLIDNASCADQIEILLGFDSDDPESFEFFQHDIGPELDQHAVTYTCLGFDPLGYEKLHVYVNTLAGSANGEWFVFWNDDAIMQQEGWDSVILSHSGKFCLQAFDTHNMHPYSIFPVVPREWFQLFDRLSNHQLNDAWLSQIAWMLDIVERIDVKVDHDRFDLTGNNKDQTFESRRIFEGNPKDPRDFNHVSYRSQRFNDANIIAQYLSAKGLDMTRWDKICKGTQDPWDTMIACDINKQIVRLP